jgi:phytanoyl-CoA hydroxylase
MAALEAQAEKDAFLSLSALIAWGFCRIIRCEPARQHAVKTSSAVGGFMAVIQEVQTQGSLTEKQLAEYNREGYIVLHRLLDERDMRPAREAMMHKVDLIANDLCANKLIRDKHESEPFETRLARLFDDLTDADFTKWGRSWRDRFSGYYELMSNPKILDVVESLIGSELFSNPVYNVRPKVPRVASGAVPWHQDKSYWPDANANPVITVWIPLVDATLLNGCLHIIPRTHKKRALAHGSETYSGTGYLEVAPSEIESRRHEIVALPIEAGSAIVFNDRLIHMSTPNNSDEVRWSVDLRYQPTDQDPMPQHGAGFLARSRKHPERVATREDWLAQRTEHQL